MAKHTIRFCNPEFESEIYTIYRQLKDSRFTENFSDLVPHHMGRGNNASVPLRRRMLKSVADIHANCSGIVNCGIEIKRGQEG
jgi:hypothetical protein